MNLPNNHITAFNRRGILPTLPVSEIVMLYGQKDTFAIQATILTEQQQKQTKQRFI